MQRGGRVIHPVDELARQFGEENPNASEMAAYRETARRLYDTMNPVHAKERPMPEDEEQSLRGNCPDPSTKKDVVVAMAKAGVNAVYGKDEWSYIGELARQQSLTEMTAALAVAREGWVPAEKFESMRHVICNDCKGHQMFTIEDDTIYVHHGCINGKHGREIWEQQEKDHEQQLSTMVPAEYVRKISDELIALALQLGFLKEDFVITNEELLSMSKSMREEIQKLALHEGLYSEAQVEWATYDAVLEWSGDVRNAIDIRTSVITRLTRPQESVTIHQDPDNFDCYEVHLYNQTIHSFHGLVHAERYAAGLREDIASKEQK